MFSTLSFTPSGYGSRACADLFKLIWHIPNSFVQIPKSVPEQFHILWKVGSIACLLAIINLGKDGKGCILHINFAVSFGN